MSASKPFEISNSSSSHSNNTNATLLSVSEYEQVVTRILVHLLNERGENVSEFVRPSTPVTERRRLVRALLTIRSPLPTALPSPLLHDIDTLLASELAHQHVTDAAALPTLDAVFRVAAEDTTTTTTNSSLRSFLSSVSVWRGSITTLRADAIVNAANSALLGCFQPTHLCIDNVIHAAAGPRLREACMRTMMMKKKKKKEKTQTQTQGENDDDDDVELEQEPNGRCRVTPAFSLPSRFVLHTVGPQLSRPPQQQHHHRHRGGRRDGDDDDDDDDDDNAHAVEPTPKEVSELASCYTSCLDAVRDYQPSASTSTSTSASSPFTPITTVAFCCISTGLFAFPQAQAAQIAIDTVRSWLTKQAAAGGRPIHVIFNVFKEDDEKHYLAYLQRLTGVASVVPSPSSTLLVPSASAAANAALALACEWAKQSTAVLFSGGAGLSASAGLDYTSHAVFKKLFPAMWRRGHRCMYEFIGYTDWEPALQWGYLFSQCNIARYNWPKHRVYQALHRIATESGRQWWVNTSNADGMFEQNGFDTSKIYTIQGEYGYMQCLKPCSSSSRWPSRPFIDAALPHVNPETQEITKPDVIPKCKNCGGAVMYNVRGGDWFIEEPFLAKRQQFQQWMQEHVHSKNSNSNVQHSSSSHISLLSSSPDKRLLIIEIGAGFNTPSVLRWPNERLAAQYDNVHLVRINMGHPEVPIHIQRVKAVGVEMDATEAVVALAKAMGVNMDNAKEK